MALSSLDKPFQRILQYQTGFQNKKVQVDALSVAYNTIKEKHTTMESALSNAEELLFLPASHPPVQ
jgi:hypothetical protein